VTSKDQKHVNPIEQFDGSNYASIGYSPSGLRVYLQHHRPEPENNAYHFHPSIEINFLVDCDMTYSFSGNEVNVPQGRFCIFWAAHPHRVVSVQGKGQITNIYVSLSEFLKWSLPPRLVNDLLSGAVISSKAERIGDFEVTSRWAEEIQQTSERFQRLHSLEVQSRLFRLSVEGWETLLEATVQRKTQTVGGKGIVQFEKMLRFIANRYGNPIKIRDVAAQAGLSERYAISLFSKLLGRTIKQHINDTRMFHARMLLKETDLKILTIALDTGFGSLSAFYDAFTKSAGMSPAAFRRGELSEK